MTVTAFNRKRRELAAAAEAAAAVPEGPKPLEKMNKSELVEAASERGIDPGSMTKAELLAAITAAEAQSDGDQTGDQTGDQSGDQGEAPGGDAPTGSGADPTNESE